jgi:hypothetical protein
MATINATCAWSSPSQEQHVALSQLGLKCRVPCVEQLYHGGDTTSNSLLLLQAFRNRLASCKHPASTARIGSSTMQALVSDARLTQARDGPSKVGMAKTYNYSVRDYAIEMNPEAWASAKQQI